MIRFARVIQRITQARSFTTRKQPTHILLVNTFNTPSLLSPSLPLSLSTSLQQTRPYTRVTRRTNIIHIRRRKMNIHKFKKRRRLLKNSTRHSMSKKKKSRPLMLKERKEIAGLLEYFKAIKMM